MDKTIAGGIGRVHQAGRFSDAQCPGNEHIVEIGRRRVGVKAEYPHGDGANLVMAARKILALM